MNPRKFSELIFETTFAFLDGNIDIRNYDGDYEQMATVCERDNEYILTAHYPMHNPIYTKHYHVTGEYSMIFKLHATVRVEKSLMTMSLAQGFNLTEETLVKLADDTDPVYSMEGPPSNLDPDGKLISLTTHFRSARGGMNLAKVTFAIPKSIGDEWCDLLYHWATQ